MGKMPTAVKPGKRQPRTKKAHQPKVASVVLPAITDEHLDAPTLKMWLWAKTWN
jgi:hypothetical protein